MQSWWAEDPKLLPGNVCTDWSGFVGIKEYLQLCLSGVSEGWLWQVSVWEHSSMFCESEWIIDAYHSQEATLVTLMNRFLFFILSDSLRWSFQSCWHFGSFGLFAFVLCAYHREVSYDRASSNFNDPSARAAPGSLKSPSVQLLISPVSPGIFTSDQPRVCDGVPRSQEGDSLLSSH